MNEVIKKKRGDNFKLMVSAMEVSEAVSLAGFQAFLDYPDDVVAIVREGVSESDAINAKQATITINVMPGQVRFGAIMEKTLIISGDVELFSIAGKIREETAPGLYTFLFNVTESFCLAPPASPGQEGKDILTQWKGVGMEVLEPVEIGYKLTVYLRIV